MGSEMCIRDSRLPEENFEIMTEVMSDKDLHIKAVKAYKHAGMPTGPMAVQSPR